MRGSGVEVEYGRRAFYASGIGGEEEEDHRGVLILDTTLCIVLSTMRK